MKLTRILSTLAVAALATLSGTSTAAPGDLDLTFGGTGKVTTAIGSSRDEGNSVVVQNDGKIVVAGWSSNASNSDFALVRYNVDGTLDTSFNGTGKVTTDFGGGSSDVAYSVAVQADGKIVVFGSSDNGGTSDFELARYNTNGSLDTGFGNAGKVTTGVGIIDVAGGMTLQGNGKIVVAGSSRIGSNDDIALLRYEANGTLDSGFGTGGQVTTDVGSNSDVGASVAVQEDGKIVIAGYYTDASTRDFALVRYNTNGSLDTSFGSGGKVTTGIGISSDDIARSVTVQQDGRIVVAGSFFNGDNYDFALVRYNVDGTLDTSFSEDGKVTADFGSGNDEIVYDVALQADGKFVVAGWMWNGINSDFALARYNANGSIDTDFGSGGTMITGIGINDEGRSVAVTDDWKIVVAGMSYNGSGTEFAVVRYDGGIAVPEPSTFALLSLSIVTLFGASRRCQPGRTARGSHAN